jgi:hypothetical protein
MVWEIGVADIFEEVDEEVRRDRLDKLWQQYGKYLIVALVLIVGGTAASVGWREYRAMRQREFSDQFQAAAVLAEEGKTVDAVEALGRLSGDATAGYAMLARFREAAVRAGAGDADAAIAIYEALATDDGLDQVYRDLATLLAVMHQVDTGEADALSQRLEPLAADGSAWRHTARELLAALALKSGDRTRARKEFTRLANDLQAPRGARARAAEMLRALGG